MDETPPSRHSETPGALMLSKLGHELRGPLTAVLGLTKIMRAKLDNGTVNTAQQRRHLELIQDSTDHMLQTVDRIAAIAKLDVTPKAVSARFDCRTTLRRVVDSVRTSADRHQRVLVVDLPDQPAVADGDENALERLLTEIVDNAIKYSDQPQVRIVLRVTPDRRALIEVNDDGPGMTAEELATIFTPFRRARAAECGSVPGSGLGLHLAARLAHRSGMELDVRSTLGAGTTFTVRLGG